MTEILTEGLLDGLPDAILILNPEGQAVFANLAAKALFDHDIFGQNVGLPIEDFSVLQVVSQGELRKVELRVADASSWRKGCVAVVMRDVTEREALAVQREKQIFELKGFAELIDVTPIPIARVTIAGKVLWANTAFRDAFGKCKNVGEIPIIFADPERLASVLAATPKARKSAPTLRTETFQPLVGSEMPLVVHSVALAAKSTTTEAEYVLLFSAVNASDELLQAYLSLVFADITLGLPNERGLLLQSAHNWEDGDLEQSAFSVLIPSTEPAELDAAVERLISLISSLWADVMPQPEGNVFERPLVPLRLGRLAPNVLGCIISLPRSSPIGAADAAFTMSKKISDAARDEIALGVVTDTRASASLKAAIDEAIFAAQFAQESGKPMHAFQDDYSETLERRRAITAAVRTAVEKKTFILEFQARWDTRSGEIRSAEILARCVDPTLGVIPPSEFIPVLRRLNLMTELTEIVGHLAIQQLAQWQKRTRRPISLSINIVPSDLSSSRALSVLRSMARQFGENGVFEVELAETYPFPVSEHGKLRALLEGMGIQLSLDDFGTGYSSFAYLISLPISVIKIDKSFIDDLLLEKRKVAAIALIRSIVALARELRLSVCAEGVEVQEQLDILIPLGIDEIQGYLVSKPLSAKDFEAKYLK